MGVTGGLLEPVMERLARLAGCGQLAIPLGRSMVIVSTALIAGASMLGALTLISQASPLYLVPVAVLWGLIIANVVWRSNQRIGLCSHHPVPIREMLDTH